jgi:hypothetical protein
MAESTPHFEITGNILENPPKVVRPKEKPKAKAKPKEKPKAKPGLTPQEKTLFAQEHADIAKEGKASPSELKKLVRQVENDQTKVDVDTGLGHPDAQELIQAGIDPKRVQQLANAHAPTHPTATVTAAQPNAGTGWTLNPTTPAQYAADVLLETNEPDTASNEALLEEQMKNEGMPGSENNPLATTMVGPGSSAVNSVGVQEYPTLAEGATEEAATLESNDPGLLAALKSGTATPQQYAQALAGSDYEGDDPAANAAYANSFLQNAGQPEEAFPGGGAATPGGGGYSSGVAANEAGSQALANAAGSNSGFQALASLLQNTTPGAAATSQLQQTLANLANNPEQQTEEANTGQGQQGDQKQTQNQQNPTPQTAPTAQPLQSAATYQALLQALLPGITPGSAGK